jgi:hypothetical protein
MNEPDSVIVVEHRLWHAERCIADEDVDLGHCIDQRLATMGS